jgi:ubiquinone/menaquinone biosynthesis C-methylase UbiE
LGNLTNLEVLLMQKLMQFLKEKVENRIRPMIEGIEIHHNPFITGKFFPLNTSTTNYVVKLENSTSDFLPVPPKELWEGYAETEEEYLECGRNDIATLLTILGKAGESSQTLIKVLDLGCAAGRMLRHYPSVKGTELWGSDINAKYINWCQQSFGEPFFFVTNSTSPHLPFEDNYFDLVYCGSVFTHITDMSDAWFLEIKRILRKGGYAYITIHDQHTLDVMFNKYKDHPLFQEFNADVRQFYDSHVTGADGYAYFTMHSDPISQVFYNRNFLLKKWSRFANVISINPEAHDHQTAILLQKPLS